MAGRRSKAQLDPEGDQQRRDRTELLRERMAKAALIEGDEETPVQLTKADLVNLMNTLMALYKGMDATGNMAMSMISLNRDKMVEAHQAYNDSRIEVYDRYLDFAERAITILAGEVE